jgi:hypothetical protein
MSIYVLLCYLTALTYIDDKQQRHGGQLEPYPTDKTEMIGSYI